MVGACGSDDSGDPDTTLATLEEVATTHAAPVTTTGAPERFEGQLAGLTVIDENTFTVELTEADPEFLLRLANVAFFAMPDSALEDPDAQNEMPIGNGPFMMAEPREHDVRIRAVRNLDYQGPHPAKVDSYEWVLHLSREVAYNEVLTGDVDIVRKIPSALLPQAERDFGANFRYSDSGSIYYLGVPLYLEQYTKEHRHALSMAIDRERLVEEFFAGSATAAHSVIPRALGGREHVCESWDYQPEQARELWDTAGGLDEITIWFNSGAGHESWIRAVVDMWGETLGIDTSTVTFEAPEFLDYMLALHNDEITGPFRLGWGQDYPSPLDFLEPLYASYNTVAHGGNNPTKYNNPDFDAALAAGKAKVAASSRLEDGLADYFAAEDLLCEDVPVIPIGFPVTTFVHSDNVSNVYVDSFGDVGYTVVESESGTVVELRADPLSLVSTDPAESEGAAVLRALNTGLIQYDPRTNQPENGHATTVTSDDGGKIWTIVLDPGWTFHDGTPNDAASYVKTWSFGATAGNNATPAGIDAYRNIVGYDELNPRIDEG
jgi:ABC-type transport system substrate-binding protein